ncbi:hypothetical protein [Kitasatospora sp. NBC_00458]|uniref:hypothetical protein n=1 Tax=Kitasatospora sp. NBC_00458 TaxID=2903568 RepID=UPI002E180F03
MLSVLLLPAALLTAGAAHRLGLAAMRSAAGWPRALTAVAGGLAVLGTAVAVGRLAWPSYLAPFAAVLWAAGGFSGIVTGLLRRTAGRHG